MTVFITDKDGRDRERGGAASNKKKIRIFVRNINITQIENKIIPSARFIKVVLM